MNSYKKLVGNSFIFAVGSLGSKLISIILVPLYTYYLTTSEYGTVDLLITTVTMLLPIVSVSIFEALLRYVMDKSNNPSEVLAHSVFVAGIGYGVFLLFFPILAYFNVFGPYLIYLYLLLLVQIMERILAQYARAINYIKVFAFNGILLTFTTGILNLLFLIVFKLGVPGYFVSMILANIISVIFMFFATKVHGVFKVKTFNLPLVKDMLGYSIPLIPNSLMWWLINASSRYFIRFFVGAAGNGLFAVASKIPTLINLINQIFSQAWQISAIEEFDSENKSDFYSNVFRSLASVMFIGTSAIVLIVKLFFDHLFSEAYFTSWKVVPFLLLGTVFSSFSGFLGTNYVAAKETKGVFKTSIYGGGMSLVLNFILIPYFGIIGAGLSSMISFFFMFVLRVVDTRKFITMKIDWKVLLSNIGIILLQTAVLYSPVTPVVEYSVNLTLFIVLLLLNRHLFVIILKVVKARKKNKK